MCHLSTPNENATFCSSGIICIYSTDCRNGKKQAKKFSLLYDNSKYIKNIPSQYFTYYIKSWK